MAKGGKNGVELAKAYVQIVPSMEGIQSGIENALNGGGGMGDIGARAGDVLGKGLTSAFTKAVGFLKDSVETGMGFDSAMSQVAATMGVTVDEIAELRDYAKEMGAETAFSATQSAEALNFMALAGYDAETSMKMLPNVMNLAAAGGMELARASDMVTDSQTALGLSIEDTEVLVDQMAKTSSKTNTSVSQLGDAMLTIGGTAKNLSGGTEELNQVLGILADNGIKAGEAGTHLRNIILAMNPTTKDAKEAFAQLSLEAYDSQGNLRGMSEIFGELSEKTKEMTSQERTDIIGKMFKITDIAAVNALLDTNAERWDEVAAAIDDASGAAEAMADTQLDNLQGDITLLKSAFEGLQIQLSDELSGDLRGLVQAATEGITWLTEHTHTLIGVIGGIGTALAAAKLPAMIGAAKTAMTAFNAVCANNTLGAVLTAAVSAALVLKGVIDDATDAINEIPDAFEGLDEGEIDFVKETAESTNDLEEATNRLKEAEDKLHDARNERSMWEANLRLALREYNELMEKGTQSSEDFARAAELANEEIPKLREKVKEQDAAVGKLSETYLSVKGNVRGLTEAQEQEQKAVEETTAAEIEQAETEEELAAKKELFAEKLKTSMKEALTVNIELNGKTAELSRTTAESMGEIIDSYDEMYAHQKQAIESSFDLFKGFTADASLTFDTLMQNLKNTSFYMNDWATAIEELGQKGVSKKLLDELKNMGADSWQIIYAMNHASKEQLKEYSDLWDRTQTQITTTTDRMMADEKSRVETELSGLAGMPGAKLEEIKAAFAEAGLVGVKGYADGIEEHFDLAEKAVDDLVDDQIKKFGDSEGKWEDIGKMIPRGLAEGMKDKEGLEALNDAVSAIVERVTTETEKQFKIESPSKVFAAMGKFLPAGLAVGMEDGTDSAEKAAADMANGVIDSARSELTGADISIGVNADIDRVSRADSYRGEDYDKDFAAPASQPMTVKIVAPDGRTLAEWLLPDINAALGSETVLQSRSYAR